MRAIVVDELGGPEVLRLREVDPPQPAADEVVIKARHIGVNFADVKARRGNYHGAKEPPFIPGLDVAGEVLAVGSAVDGFRPGAWVAAATHDGAYAEVVRAKASLCYDLPTDVDPRQAAALVVLMTAYNVLLVKGQLEPGETVLVHGAAGGVGSVLLQLARRMGAGRIIAAVGSENKREVASSFGADEVVVGRGAELAARIEEAVPGGVDLLLDPIAGEHFASGLRSLAPFGRAVVFGSSGGEGRFTTGPLHASNRSVIGYSSGHYRRNRPSGVRRAALAMLDLLAAGEIEVPVTRTFPLAEAAAAHSLLESRQSTGKLLLEP